MTVQLSKAQIDALKVELGKYGLTVSKAKKPKADVWEQRNNARRSKYWWMGRPTVGVTSYRIKGADGLWYAIGEPGFEAAKAERKAIDATIRPGTPLYPAFELERIGAI